MEKLIRTPEEAIDCLKKNKPTSGYIMLQESVDMAIEALEKQIPKEIVTRVQKEDLKIGHVTFKAGTNTYYCPACNKAITLSDTCCRWCGQKLELN